ncbi:hypothetical protein [Paractinoplanes durhamensis]|uniref:hypothetical protein n=1 Tax=Paractinoplanes durhamensis TaxID=113563 RepID=UPI00364132F1
MSGSNDGKASWATDGSGSSSPSVVTSSAITPATPTTTAVPQASRTRRERSDVSAGLANGRGRYGMSAVDGTSLRGSENQPPIRRSLSSSSWGMRHPLLRPAT